MIDCIGLVCMTCSGRNPQYLHTVIHCPGCQENAKLEQNQDEQIYELRHDRDLWHREHGKLQEENAQLREQLADVTAQRDLLVDMCPAEKENARLREQLAHALRCPDPICETCRDLKRALATLPDAPKEEEP